MESKTIDKLQKHCLLMLQKKKKKKKKQKRERNMSEFKGMMTTNN